ncbi:MAG: TonB-dependent receptor plug domain-containing protein, partial [Luteimonas sp.]
MSLKTSKLRDAITFALAMGVTSLAGTGVASAQTTAPAPARTTAPATDQKDPTTLDRITVTGTRIRQVDVETAQPVQLITREDIEKQGFQSVADILQNISATGTPPISRASPLSAGENSGGTFISLRNLGAPRTLILLNGKRLGISTSGFSDISTIPAAAVERIEVLKDGASSIYGSDAIAGVINIITRSNFKGGAVSAYIGQYDQGDGEIKNGDFVIGFAEKGISVTVGGEVREEDAVFARDRDFSAFPRSNLHPTDQWTTVSQFGGFASTRSQAFPNVTYPAPTPTNPNPSVRVVLREGGDPRNRADYINQNINVGECAASGCTAGSTLHKSNTNEQTDLRTPVKSRSFFLDGILEINDNVRLRTNLLYSDRDSSRTVAGFPMQAGAFATTRPGLSAQSYFNPTNNFGTTAGTPITTWFRRGWEIPRVSDANLKIYRISAAIEGNFDWGDRFVDWDVGFLHNTTKQRQETYGNFNLPNTQRAVGPSFLNAQGRVQCGTAAAPVPFSECVPFNPFLPFGRAGEGGLTNNQELQSYLFRPELATGETKTQVFHANVTSTLFALPAGDLAFAAGIERREESGAFVPDPLATAGLTSNLSSGPTRGEYNVNEAYLELQVPLLADVAFAKELTLSLASRYSDYDTFGETTNNSISLKWRPIDSLLLR